MTDRIKGRRSARALGLVSAALGVPALVAPDTVSRLIGVAPDDEGNAVLRAVAVQELGASAGLLTRSRPVGFQWSRVAGDFTHLLLLAGAMARPGNDRRRIGNTMAAVGGVALVDLLVAVRLTGSRPAEPLTARTAITVRKPVDDVYRHWRRLENLPEFMHHLESVSPSGDGRSRWVAKAPAGTTVAWEAEITEDVPGERIAWKSVKGSKVQTSGSVQFRSAPAGQGTEILVDLTYSPPAGRVGAAVAKLFGEEPEQQVRDDLRRFKQVLEVGEVVRSDGVPDGTRSQRQMLQRPAQPPKESNR